MNVIRIKDGMALASDAGRAEPKPNHPDEVAAGERARDLLAQARAVSLEHLAKLQEALAEARALSEGVVEAGDLSGPGLHDFARRLGEELLWRSRTLEALSERQRDAARAHH